MKTTTQCLATSFAIALTLATLSRPAGAQTYEPAPVPVANTEQANVPPGHHVEKRIRRGWVIAGSIVLGSLYGLGVLSASNQDTSSPSKYLAIPVVGPWIALGALGSYDEEACDRQVAAGKICPSKSGAREAYTLFGVGQLAGIGMIVGGVLWKRTDVVPDFVVRHDLTIAPIYAGNVSTGVAVAGTF